MQFCSDNGLAIMNTWFQHHNRRLYTWESPDGKTRNQIDSILTKQRYRNTIRNVKTYPGADIGSDHNPVVAKVNIKLKQISVAKRNPNLEMN